MSELSTGLIVVAITAALVGLIFILTGAQKRKREAAISTMANMNGWSFELINSQTAAGWKLHKGDWTIEAIIETTKNSSDNSQSSTSTGFTRWFCATPRLSDGIVLIGPHQPEINLGGINDVLLQVALRLMIGDEANFTEGIQRVELGSLELMARYMVWTNREETAKKLLDDQLEAALRAWPIKMPPVVKFSPRGLEIKIQGLRLEKEADLTALVKLGNTLLDSAYQVEKGNKPL
jgi:hypothetical protein